MADYTHLFQIFLALYCFIAFAFLTRPLQAVIFFLFFRASFSIAAYLKIPSFSGLPYFVPSILVLFLQTCTALLTSKTPFRINHIFGTYILILAIILCVGIIHIFIGYTSLVLLLTEFSKYMVPILAYILVYVGIREQKDIRKLTYLIALASIIPILTGFVEFLFDVGLDYYNTYMFIQGFRPSGTIIDPNLYGIYLSLCLFIALTSLLQDKKRKSAILYVLLVVFMIIVARNRGTWIALFLAFAFAVPVFSSKLSLTKWMSAALIIVILAIPVLITRFSDLEKYDQWGQKKDTASGRYEYSVALFDHAIQSPIIGHGVGNYDVGHYMRGGKPYPPHNDYLLIANQYGFPVMIIFMLFLAFQLKWTFKHRHSYLWSYQFASMLCQIYLIIMSVVQNIVQDNTSYALLFSIMAISHRAASFEQTQEKEERETSSSNIKDKKWPRWVPDDKKKSLLDTKSLGVQNSKTLSKVRNEQRGHRRKKKEALLRTQFLKK